MKVTQNGEKLFIEVEPEGHNAKVMKSGRHGFFGRKIVKIEERTYRVQVLGYAVEDRQRVSPSPAGEGSVAGGNSTDREEIKP